LQPEVHIQQQIWKGLRQGTGGGHGAWASPKVVADGAAVLAVGATGGEDRGMGGDGSTGLARAVGVVVGLGAGEGAGGGGVGGGGWGWCRSRGWWGRRRRRCRGR